MSIHCDIKRCRLNVDNICTEPNSIHVFSEDSILIDCAYEEPPKMIKIYKNPRTGVVHAENGNGWVICLNWIIYTTEWVIGSTSDVTCKRCLASLNKHS